MISAESNVTALVPSKDAFANLSTADELFWTDYYRLPYLLQYVSACSNRSILNRLYPTPYKGICTVRITAKIVLANMEREGDIVLRYDVREHRCSMSK